MIAIDTNVLVRMLINDHEGQSKAARQALTLAEKYAVSIFVPVEVLIETVWVLESVYHCHRKEIAAFLDKLIHTNVFAFSDRQMVRKVVDHYKTKGDFADLVIVYQSMGHRAVKLLSFDRELCKAFPDYVVNNLNEGNLAGS
jgi:predicted nucleic-acid-binding protein